MQVRGFWGVLLLALAACDGGAPPAPSVPPGPEILQAERLLMGTRFAIQLVTGDDEAGRAAIEAAFAEVARVEDLISEWRPQSEISRAIAAAGDHPVAIGPELRTVVGRAQEIAELTGGAFDITFASCGHLWSFARPRVPEPEEIAACLPRVGYRRVALDRDASTLFLPEAGQRIGISGLGKGYGVDRAADVLGEHGFVDYIVDGGGDIRLSGRKVAAPWITGIAHPRRPGELYAKLVADRPAIVTSGDYEQYFELAGVRYHHIFDPATGRPARESVAVTVVAATAMDADALATGLFVMGPDAGLALVESLPGVDALFFGPDLEVRASSGFPSWTVLE